MTLFNCILLFNYKKYIYFPLGYLIYTSYLMTNKLFVYLIWSNQLKSKENDFFIINKLVYKL